MAWQVAINQLPAGAFILADVARGVSFGDWVGGVSETEILAAIAERANGWTPTQAIWTGGLFETLQVLGMVGPAPIAVTNVQSAVSDGVNSFWSIMFATTKVSYSTTQTPLPSNTSVDGWQKVLSLLAIALIAGAVVYGFHEVRKAIQ